jgi:hypothetical protein
MELYSDVNGDSGVAAYEIGQDYIDVQFKKSGVTYRYSYSSAGADAVEQMKRLAQAGDGLNSFIMKHVRSGFESKW